MHRGFQKILAANWKMNHGPQETEAFFQALAPLWGKNNPLTPACRVLLFPPSVSLSAARNFVLPGIELGAQNALGETEGAFTGEISGPMLQQLGIQWVLLGHSERRSFFQETEYLLRQKLKGLLAQGFSILYCVGETAEEREKGLTAFRLREQLVALFEEGEHQKVLAQCVLAYEPVWAIGTGKSASPDLVCDTLATLRALLQEWLSPFECQQLPLLYGGSVQKENLAALLQQTGVDGVLVGGASLLPSSFFRLVQQVVASSGLAEH